MPLDPGAVGATTSPTVSRWSNRDTLLYALGVGAGVKDPAFTTENSHGVDQQVLPTYAIIACSPFAAAGLIGSFDATRLLHGSQSVRLFSPLPASGALRTKGGQERRRRDLAVGPGPGRVPHRRRRRRRRRPTGTRGGLCRVC